MPDRPNPDYNFRDPSSKPTLHSKARRPSRAAKAAGSGAKKSRANMGIPSEQWIANAAKGIKPG